MQERRRLWQVAARPSGRSYSRHDTQECDAAGFGRDDIDDRSFRVESRLLVLNALRGVVAPVVLFSSFIYAFGCLSELVFFFVFHRAQR